jgi:hypothetical protein
MKTKVTVEIECGITTCASEPGKFCRHLGTSNYGTIWWCLLFPGDGGSKTRLFEDRKDGWIQRCPACIVCAQRNILDSAISAEDK